MSAVSVASIVVDRSEGVGDLVLDLLRGEAGEAGLARLQAEHDQVSPFSMMSLYCASVSLEQEL